MSEFVHPVLDELSNPRPVGHRLPGWWVLDCTYAGGRPGTITVDVGSAAAHPQVLEYLRTAGLIGEK